jgi:PAS domain S-box-containing protein
VNEPTLEQQQAEVVLRESEERFRQIAANIPGGIYRAVYTPEGNVSQLFLSESYRTLLGYEPQTLMDQPEHLFEIIYPADRGQFIKALKAGSESLEPAVLEYRLVNASGAILWIRDHAQFSRGENGELIVDGIDIDITAAKQSEAAREQAEAALREGQYFLQKLLRTNPNIIYVYDLLENRNVYVNRGIAETLGYSQEALQQMGGGLLHYLIHPDDYQRIEAHDRRCAALEDNEIAEVEYRSRHADGEWHWLQSRDTVFSRTLDGKVKQILGTAQDITDAKHNEAMRQQAEAALQQLNINLENQVQERTAQLQQSLEFEALLKRITDHMRDSLNEEQILQTVVQELAQGLDVECCDTGIYNADQTTCTIFYEFTKGRVAPIQGQTFAIATAAYAEIYTPLFQGQICQFSDITPNQLRLPQGFLTILACPILDGHKIIGDLWLFKPVEESFNDQEVRLVQQVANQCAIALRHSRLYQAAQAQVQKLERLNQLKFINYLLNLAASDTGTKLS